MANIPYSQRRGWAFTQVKSFLPNNSKSHSSGIYIYERVDENGIGFFYVGQAKDIFERQIGHFTSYNGHIDSSLKSRGIYSQDNIYGWHFRVIELCPLSKLDELETYYIIKYMKMGKQSYNTTYGSQGKGKSTITEYKESGGYRKGVLQGRSSVLKDIKHLFDLHLNAVVKKGGKRQEQALDKFYNMLKEVDNDK